MFSWETTKGFALAKKKQTKKEEDTIYKKQGIKVQEGKKFPRA